MFTYNLHIKRNFIVVLVLTKTKPNKKKKQTKLNKPNHQTKNSTMFRINSSHTQLSLLCYYYRVVQSHNKKVVILLLVILLIMMHGGTITIGGQDVTKEVGSSGGFTIDSDK